MSRKRILIAKRVDFWKVNILGAAGRMQRAEGSLPVVRRLKSTD
jgi:hypothetical protein